MSAYKHLSWFAAVLITSLSSIGMAHAEPASHPSTSPESVVRIVDGFRSSEDLIQIPETPWLIVSEMAVTPEGSGRLQLVDSRTGAAREFYPAEKPASRLDKTSYGECPGPLPAGQFRPHGLTIRRGKEGVHTLYVVHHGVRESIEAFAVEVKAGQPKISWVGCVPLPPGSVGNSVAALPGGLVISDTKVVPPAGQEAEWADRIRSGQSVGQLLEWNPADGWRKVPTGGDIMPNGIEASLDGAWLYYSDSARETFNRLSRGRTPVRKEWFQADFHTDNVHWSPDGKLILAGQKGDLKDIARCVLQGMENLCGNLVVLRIDPESLHVDTLLDTSAYKRASGAIQVDDGIWVGSIRGPTIMGFPLRRASKQ